MTENREQKRNVGAGLRARPKRGQPRGVAPTILGILLSVFCYLSSVFCVDVLAIEWPWRRTKEHQPPKGMSPRQVLERNELNQSQLERQMLTEQKKTVIHAGNTYVDLYDEKGVATRLNLDQNGDGKVRTDDLLLIRKLFAPEKSHEGTVTASVPFQKIEGLETIYLGKMNEEAALLNDQAESLEKEIAIFDSNELPVLDDAQRHLMNELFGLEERISRIEKELVPFGVEIIKGENGEEEFRVGQAGSPRSTVDQFLEERRQLLIQVAKIKELIQGQETQRTQYLRHKRELESKMETLQRTLRELQEERKRIQDMSNE